MRTQNQSQIDKKDQSTFGCVASARPGDHVKVRGVINRKKGPEVEAVVINARVSSGVVGEDEVLVATREYGRRWFATSGSSFQIVRKN
jgi:hypothetical protein